MSPFWFYNDTQVSSLDQLPDGIVGFVYKITSKESGKIYIGKKQIESVRNKPLTKKEISEWDRPGRVPKKRKVVSESDWVNYWGSSKTLQEDLKTFGKDRFTRQILHLCFSKKQLSYYETYYQFKYKVLHIDSFNDNILGKYFRKDI